MLRQTSRRTSSCAAFRNDVAQIDRIALVLVGFFVARFRTVVCRLIFVVVGAVINATTFASTPVVLLYYAVIDKVIVVRVGLVVNAAFALERKAVSSTAIFDRSAVERKHEAGGRRRFDVRLVADRFSGI